MYPLRAKGVKGFTGGHGVPPRLAFGREFRLTFFRFRCLFSFKIGRPLSPFWFDFGVIFCYFGTLGGPLGKSREKSLKMCLFWSALRSFVGFLDLFCHLWGPFWFHLGVLLAHFGTIWGVSGRGREKY